VNYQRALKTERFFTRTVIKTSAVLRQGEAMNNIDLGGVIVYDPLPDLVSRKEIEEAIRKHMRGEFRSLGERIGAAYSSARHGFYDTYHYSSNGHRFVVCTTEEDGQPVTYAGTAYPVDFSGSDRKERPGPWFQE